MISFSEKISAERVVCLRHGEDWSPTAGGTFLMEFFTKNRVSNATRIVEILATLKVSRDSFALTEIRERLPRYELAEEVVKALNAKGHSLPADGFVPAFSLSSWCEREHLNRVDFAWDVRTIAAFMEAKGLEVVAIEAPKNLHEFLEKNSKVTAGLEDRLELLDLLESYSTEPLRILANTRDR